MSLSANHPILRHAEQLPHFEKLLLCCSSTPPVMTLQLLKQAKAFDGSLRQYAHESAETKCTMKFHIFLPPNASEAAKVPVLYYLAGLTCDDERAFVKAPNFMKAAAARGIAVVTPDTSPRGVNIPGEDDSWDFGSAAGFYVDATEPKWSAHYRMYSYVTKELPALINANFPVLEGRQSITGHSMGGHGALTIALRNPDKYKSVSAFAPIAHPTQCPWGIKAFTGYLGSDQETWRDHDATLLLLKSNGALPYSDILIDQGLDDQFLHDKQLLVDAFEAAAKQVNQKVTVRNHEGYDHLYYFIATYIEDHVNFHADALLQ